MKFIFAALFAAGLSAAETRSAWSAETGHSLLQQLLSEHQNNQPRRIGVMAGARHYCGLEVKQFLAGYRLRIGPVMQRPEVLWNRMIDEARTTIKTLGAEGVECDEGFKAELGRLAY